MSLRPLIPLLPILLLLAGCDESSGSIAQCKPDAAPGSECMLHVDDLRPTQFAVGRVAVECKKRKIEAKSKDELEEWLATDKRRVPVVVGPGGRFYIIDRHHTAMALYLADPFKDWGDEDKRMRVSVKENRFLRTNNDQTAFWDWMLVNNAAWLHDNKGLQPMNPALLPKNLGEMLNDPYRTLSRWVRESCGYLKSTEQRCQAFGEGGNSDFMEFHWADYFREKTPLPLGDAQACAYLPYAEGCLNNEVSALIELYPVAMEAALSLDAKNYLEYVGLHPEKLGFNPTGKSLWVSFDARGCETVD